MNRFIVFLFFYFPYRVFKYYENEPAPTFSAIAAILALHLFHLMSLLFILNSFTDELAVFSKSRLVNKYVIGPIFIGCIIILMSIFYAANKKNYKQMFTHFDAYPKIFHKKLGYYCLAYFIVTLGFLFISITSPSWF